jgi:hypothetical protein
LVSFCRDSASTVGRTSASLSVRALAGDTSGYASMRARLERFRAADAAAPN